jgi:hypothetical protein
MLMCEAMTPAKTMANSGRATFFFIFGLWLSSLGEGVVGGFLILEHQKSSPTHHTLNQLRTVILEVRNFTRAQS